MGFFFPVLGSIKHRVNHQKGMFHPLTQYHSDDTNDGEITNLGLRKMSESCKYRQVGNIQGFQPVLK